MVYLKYSSWELVQIVFIHQKRPTRQSLSLEVSLLSWDAVFYWLWLWYYYQLFMSNIIITVLTDTFALFQTISLCLIDNEYWIMNEWIIESMNNWAILLHKQIDTTFFVNLALWKLRGFSYPTTITMAGSISNPKEVTCQFLLKELVDVT